MAMAGESYDYPTYFLVSTDTSITDIDVTDTSIPNEIGTREAITNVRDNNVVTYNALRSGTDVINTSTGDALTAIGADIAATGDDLQFGVIVSELHTTAFDLELEAELTYGRQ